MIIGIIGSGGREHAICAKILESKKVKKVYCFPGNAGTNLIATNVEIKIDEFDKIKEFVINNKIDFLVVGPEKPLVDGIVDYFQKHNIKIFVPKKFASQLEGSKIFTKKICEKHNIPTAKFGVFSKIEDAFEAYLGALQAQVEDRWQELQRGEVVTDDLKSTTEESEQEYLREGARLLGRERKKCFRSRL